MYELRIIRISKRKYNARKISILKHFVWSSRVLLDQLTPDHIIIII